MKTLAVAKNTFREARRDRAQWILILYAVVLFGSAFVLSPLALGEAYRVTRDLGIAALSLVGVILIILVGSGMVQREIDRKTVLTVLAKPIRRHEFLIGKYLGFMAMVTAVFAGMVALLVGTLLLTEHRLEPAVLIAAAFTLGELAVMTAVVVGFSSFATPALAGIFTLTVFVIGHFTGDLLRFAETVESEGLAAGAQAVYLALPHLNAFNLRAEAAYGILPAPSTVFETAFYALFYSAGVIAVGSAVFSRREFR
jgi:ABC-type transport system involved in multi-copper enzyme maturation permease subunit